MKFGINLPLIFRSVTREELLTWATRADQSVFSSLAAIDRLVYANPEQLLTLAAAAAVTQRIELITGVMVSPIREVSLLAKQLATLDSFANGRLTVGLGVGNKMVDFQMAQTPFNRRGKIMDEQVERMKSLWSGQAVGEDGEAVGPLPVQAGGPKLLFGGIGPAAARRVSQWGEGYIASGATPAAARQYYQQIEEAWNVAGRLGKPRFIIELYYALGPDAAERGAVAIRDYYRFRGPQAEAIAQSILPSAEALKERFRALEDAGVDEIILASTIPGNDQLERLLDVIG